MRQMYINGRFTPGQATKTIQVINPATEDMLDEVMRGTAADVETAVSAAKSAFDVWKRIPAWERAGMLHEVAAKIKAHEEELTRLLTEEEGKPFGENEEEVFWTYDTFHYYAELGRHERGRFLPPATPTRSTSPSKSRMASSAALCPGTSHCCCWPGKSRQHWRRATPLSSSRRNSRR